MASEVVGVENSVEKGTWFTWLAALVFGAAVMKELVVNAAAELSRDNSSANEAAIECSLWAIVVPAMGDELRQRKR